MIQIIAGEKGKGKTKVLISKANTDVRTAKGSIVYLDKSNKHMYELSNKLRLINVRDYCIENSSEFIGFICGLLSQDNDLEKIYLDSFLKIACTDEDHFEEVLKKLNRVSEKFQVDFIISISLKQEQISEGYQPSIIVAL